MWTQEMFGVEKPIIALLHLDALPGDPGYCGSMDTVLEHARQDLVAAAWTEFCLRMSSACPTSRWRMWR